MFPVPSPSPALPRKAESKWPELVRCIPARSGHLIHTCVWTVNSKHGLVCSVHRSALGFMGRVHSTQPAPSPAAPPKGRDSSQGAMKIWELQQRRNALSQKANTVLAEKEREREKQITTDLKVRDRFIRVLTMCLGNPRWLQSGTGFSTLKHRR